MANTTTTTTSPIIELQKPYIEQSLSEAKRIYEGGAPQYYEGDTVAGLNPNLEGGWNRQVQGTDTAQGLGTQHAGGLSSGLTGITTAANTLQNQASGNDAYTNQLADKAVANTNQAFAGSGTLGGARNQLAANTAATNAVVGQQFQAANALASLGLGSGAQVGAAQQSQFLPGQQLANVGQQQQQYEQTLIDADRQKFDYQQNAPSNWLANYNQLTGFPASAQAGAQFNRAGTENTKLSTWDKIAGIGTAALGAYGLFK